MLTPEQEKMTSFKESLSKLLSPQGKVSVDAHNSVCINYSPENSLYLEATKRAFEQVGLIFESQQGMLVIKPEEVVPLNILGLYVGTLKEYYEEEKNIADALKRGESVEIKEGRNYVAKSEFIKEIIGKLITSALQYGDRDVSGSAIQLDAVINELAKLDKSSSNEQEIKEGVNLILQKAKNVTDDSTDAEKVVSNVVHEAFKAIEKKPKSVISPTLTQKPPLVRKERGVLPRFSKAVENSTAKTEKENKLTRVESGKMKKKPT